LPPIPYADLLRRAHRASRRADEAEDLLQTVLMAAVEAGRSNLACIENRRWIEGALRRRAAFEARSAVRRRQRDGVAVVAAPEQNEPACQPARFVAGLPPSLRTTTLLALTGHTRQEIAWLQGLGDAALRQRFADIRRRWRAFGGGSLEEPPGLSGHLAFGRIRRALLHASRRQGAVLASHDPDGHLFLIGSSQIAQARQHLRANATTE